MAASGESNLLHFDCLDLEDAQPCIPNPPFPPSGKIGETPCSKLEKLLVTVVFVSHTDICMHGEWLHFQLTISL